VPSPSTSSFPSVRAIASFAAGGLVVGALAAASLIVTSGIPFARWLPVLVTSQALYAVFVLPQAVFVYIVLGVAARLRSFLGLGGAVPRFAFSLTVAALLLPLAVRVNVHRPGMSLSLHHLGPYLLVGLGTVVAGGVAAWIAVRVERAVGAPSLRVLASRSSGTVIALFALAAVLFAWQWYGSRGVTFPDRAARDESSSRANAILITVDTLRPSHLQSYGYGKPTDPEIQRHFAAGLRFVDAVAPVPVTRPSHASMLTGMHPSLLGLRWNERALAETVPTLAEILRDAGYQTAAFVAAWPLFGDRSGLDRGFATYSDVFSGFAAIDHALDDLSVLTFLRKVRLIDTLQRDANAVTDDALGWLELRPPEPFFLWVHYYDPHSLYEPPEAFALDMGLSPDGPRNSRRAYSLVTRGVGLDPPLEADTMALYDGEIRYVDSNVGRLLEGLDALGVADRTVVLLTADHGETLLERAEEENLAFTHGRWIKEWDVRIPFFIRGPGIPSGVEETITVQAMDVTPTILSALGLPVPDGLTGRDALAARAGPPDNPPTVIVNSPRFGYASRISARTREYKYVLEIESGKESLYHLPTDPEETIDLITERSEIAAELRETALSLPIVTRGDAPDAEELDRLRALGYVH
jgi:arylsulfatase A-like enzyme